MRRLRTSESNLQAENQILKNKLLQAEQSSYSSYDQFPSKEKSYDEPLPTDKLNAPSAVSPKQENAPNNDPFTDNN